MSWGSFLRPPSQSFETQTVESELWRPIFHTLLELGIYALAVLSLLVEMFIIGRGLGIIVALLTFAWACDSLTLTKTSPLIKVKMNPRKLESWSIRIFSGVAVILIGLWLSGYWWPIWWDFGQGAIYFTWILGDTATTKTFPEWIIIIRLLLASIPLIAIRPAKILRWVADMERVAPNVRNAPVDRISASGFTPPVGEYIPARGQEAMVAPGTPIIGAPADVHFVDLEEGEVTI